MRVVLLIDSLMPGGAERSLAELTPPLMQRGLDVRFMVLRGEGSLVQELTMAGVTVDVLGRTGRVHWMRSAESRLRSLRPDLVHTTLFDADIVGRVASRLAGVPVVSGLVNTPYGPEYFQEFGRWRPKVRAAHLADMATARMVRRFRAVSESVKEAYVRGLRLRPELVEVIPEGRDPARLGRRTDARRSAVRASLNVGDAVVVLAVGRQDPQKGFDVLLRALPSLVQGAPNVQVLIAGRPGRSSPQLEAMCADLGGRVRLLGHRGDVADLMCAADVLVLPSRREGIPGVLQEAMALETPIVASDIGPVREAVGDPSLAELVPVGDPEALAQAVLRVLADPASISPRTSAARERFLAEFDISAIADRMVRFYRTALDTPRPPR